MLVTGMLGPSLSALLPAPGRLPARTVLQVTAPRLQIPGAQRGGRGREREAVDADARTVLQVAWKGCGIRSRACAKDAASDSGNGWVSG